MGLTELIVVITLLFIVGALAVIQRRSRAFQLRPIRAYEALRRERGMAIESGRPPLLALGTGQLHTAAGPASVAGLQVLEDLVDASGRGQVSPRATVGAGTLFPVALDKQRDALDTARQPRHFQADSVQFIADDAFPFTYAAGTADAVGREESGNSIAIGRFGMELAIIGEAASRNNAQQIMGSDDPSAIAIAMASTENSLWGEEIFAAGAYLKGSDSYLATLRVQDILRWLVAIALVAVALWRMVALA